MSTFMSMDDAEARRIRQQKAEDALRAARERMRGALERVESHAKAEIRDAQVSHSANHSVKFGSEFNVFKLLMCSSLLSSRYAHARRVIVTHCQLPYRRRI